MYFRRNNEEKENGNRGSLNFNGQEAGDYQLLHSADEAEVEDLSGLQFQVVDSRTKLIKPIDGDLAIRLAGLIQDENDKGFRQFLKEVGAKSYDEIHVTGVAINSQGLYGSFSGYSIPILWAFLGKKILFKKNVDLYLHGIDAKSKYIIFSVFGNQEDFLKSLDLGHWYWEESYALLNNNTGNPKITKFLLEKNVPQVIDRAGQTPLLRMIRFSKNKSVEKKKDYLESAKLLLKKDPSQINIKCANGWPAYFYAMENQDTEMMALLLNYKPEINKNVFDWIFSMSQTYCQEKYIDYINHDSIQVKLSSEELCELILSYGKSLKSIKNKLFDGGDNPRCEALFLAKDIISFQRAFGFYRPKHLTFAKKLNQNLLRGRLLLLGNVGINSEIITFLLNQEGVRWFPYSVELVQMEDKEKTILVDLLKLEPLNKNYLFRLWLRDNLSAEAKKEFKELLNHQLHPMLGPDQFTFLDSAELEPWNVKMDLVILTELFDIARESLSIKGQLGVADFGLAILGKRWNLPCLIQKKEEEIRDVRIEINDSVVFFEAEPLLYWVKESYEKIIASITDCDPLYKPLQEFLKCLAVVEKEHKQACSYLEDLSDFKIQPAPFLPSQLVVPGEDLPNMQSESERKQSLDIPKKIFS